MNCEDLSANHHSIPKNIVHRFSMAYFCLKSIPHIGNFQYEDVKKKVRIHNIFYKSYRTNKFN